MTTDEATKVALGGEAAAKSGRNLGDEAIEKVAEFWCFTPVKLRKNYATYWTSSGKNAPSNPTTAAELTVLQVERELRHWGGWFDEGVGGEGGGEHEDVGGEIREKKKAIAKTTIASATRT